MEIVIKTKVKVKAKDVYFLILIDILIVKYLPTICNKILFLTFISQLILRKTDVLTVSFDKYSKYYENSNHPYK